MNTVAICVTEKNNNQSIKSPVLNTNRDQTRNSFWLKNGRNHEIITVDEKTQSAFLDK